MQVRDVLFGVVMGSNADLWDMVRLCERRTVGIFCRRTTCMRYIGGAYFLPGSGSIRCVAVSCWRRGHHTACAVLDLVSTKARLHGLNGPFHHQPDFSSLQNKRNQAY